MATERQQKKGKDKWREKVWYSILTPSYMGEKEVATSPAIEPSVMIGRKIEVPIADLTGNFKKTNVKAVFRDENCQGNRCTTVFEGHYITDDSIRRMVRRRKERIDEISKNITKDGYVLAVKVVAVSDIKLISNKRADIRLAIHRFLSEKVSSSLLQDLVPYLIGDDIVNDLAKVTKQIYAVKKIEVRKSEVLGYQKPLQESTPQEIVA